MLREVFPTLWAWNSEGRRFATATVTQTWGSSPRPVGSVMGIRDDGLICGSVSGGCVETAVIEASLAAIADGQARELNFDEVTDDSVWDVGLSCGGKIQVRVAPEPALAHQELWRTIAAKLDSDQPVVLATNLATDGLTLWSPGETDPLGGAIQAAYAARKSSEVIVDGQRHFLNVVASRERLVIVGSVHIAVPLVKFAKEVGFETVVVDPRGAFANPERFPVPPDQFVVAWPGKAFEQVPLTSDTYVAVLTHDPKIDDVALEIALKSQVAYIGALGSRVTQAKRREHLRTVGFSDGDLQRIHGPIGLDIGARSPEEIALSIIAEIVQVKRSLRTKAVATIATG